MLVIPHAFIGILIGLSANNPFLSVPLALASHYILDMMPHWQETRKPWMPNKITYIRTAGEILFSAIIISSIFPSIKGSLFWSVWLGWLASIIPDVDGLIQVFPRLKSIKLLKLEADFHSRIQNEKYSAKGILTQIAVAIGSLTLILLYYTKI